MTEVRQLPGAIKSMGPISLFIRLKVVFINTSWRGIELIEEEIKSSAYSKVLIHSAMVYQQTTIQRGLKILPLFAKFVRQFIASKQATQIALFVDSAE